MAGKKSLSYRATLFALAVAVALPLGWYWFSITQTTYQVNEFQPIPFRSGDAEGEVHLRAGQHTLWLQGAFVSVRRNSAAEYRDVLSATVDRCGAGARPLPVRQTQSQVFNIGGREGRSLWAFRAPEAGSYCIRVTGTYNPDASVIWPRSVAVGEGVGLKYPVRPWFFVLLLAGLAVSVLLALRTHMKRRQAVKELDRPWTERSMWGRRPSPGSRPT